MDTVECTRRILALIRRNQPEATGRMIRFENLRGHAADLLAKQVFDGKIQADRVVKYSEIGRLLEK